MSPGGEPAPGSATSAAHRHLPVLLATLSAIGPFAIDTYLPAFPDIAQGLGASQLEVQQTLTAYLAPYAFMLLWHGAIADALGRRVVLLTGMAVFALASVLCLVAPSIEILWLGRALQGLSAGAGTVVGRAMVRDLYHGAQAQRVMAHVQIMFALAPAAAPILGGLIGAALGWRSVFGFLVLFSTGVCLWCWRALPETLPPAQRHPLHPVTLAQAYGHAFTLPPFMLLVLALAFNFSGFFIYVLSAPVFLMQHLGLSAQGFAWMFVPGVAGMMLGSYLSGRLAGRLSPRRTIACGYVVMATAAAGNVLLNLQSPPALPWAIAPIIVYNLGMALAMPSLSLLAIDLLLHRKGLAASCQGFVQMCSNALTASLIAPLAWGSTAGLAATMAVFMSAGILSFGLYLWRWRAPPQAH